MRKIREAFRSSAFALIIISVVGISVIAQEKKQEESSTNTLTGQVPTATITPLPLITPTLPFSGGFALGAIRSGASGIVKNAPFSAVMVFESIQTLYDGNRIINRSSIVMYRDSQGRTRNEHSFKPYLQSGGENTEHKTISIFDPVSGISYTLDPQTRTAHKFPVVQPADNAFTVSAPKLSQFVSKGEPQGKRVIIGSFGSASYAQPGTSFSFIDELSGKSESLGKQMIEGVEAEGTRITQTIPAGAMGNERPIETFHERWYSQELQMDVMVKWFDPRSGESTHRLTNINRSEPDISLFQPSPDYTIREPETAGSLIKMLREQSREPKDQQNR
jgi:hypothetical protein